MTLILWSVASVSPGVVLHAGGHGTFPEIHVNSAVCSYDRQAAEWRCGRNTLSASWSCDIWLQCNGAREDMRPIYLHKTRKSVSASQQTQMASVVYRNNHCLLSQSEDTAQIKCKFFEYWSRWYMWLRKGFKASAVTKSTPDIDMSFVATI